MKKFRLIYALVAVALMATACNDELIEQPKVPAADGSEIIFGGRAGFENSNPDGRTVYSGDEYTYESNKYERINWIDGDKIEIYSVDASNGPSSHYKITSISNNNVSTDDGTNKGEHYAYLESQAESSLQWNGDGDHTFYAMYPSSTMFNKVNADGSIITVEQGVKLDRVDNKIVVKGTVPTSQDGEITKTIDGNYIIAPNMDYAYMVAKEVANRIENPKVGLSFVPIVTALEIEMEIPENNEEDVYAIEMSEIRLEGKGIAGDFTANLSDWNPENGYPVCTNSTEVSYDMINISTWKDNLPIKLDEGKTVTFTVFMRPGADYTNLDVVFVPVSGRLAKTLPVTIEKNLKTRIKNLYLPAIYDEEEQIVIDNSKWMSQLPKKSKMKKLSIPGTGGSFSFASEDETGHYRSQHTYMDLDAQWNHGIRAFEIVTNRYTDSDGSIANEPIKCNGAVLNDQDDNQYDVQTVVNELLNKLEESYNAETEMYETAILIMTYQPEGSSPSRDPGSYMTEVMKYVNTISPDKLIRYSPELTLEEAQKRLMIVVRPTQNDEDDNSDWTAVENAISGDNADKVLAINGCGTTKDRWGARGYKVSKQTFSAGWTGTSYSLEHNLKAPDISNTFYESSRYGTILGIGSGTYYDYVEAYMDTEESYALSANNTISIVPTRGDGTLTVTRDKMDFEYVTNDGYNCWYQEWQRVIEENVYKTSGTWYDGNNQGYSYPAIYWFESYNEKLSNVKGTLDMAISGERSDLVYINSLCGYLANDDADNNVNCLIPSLGYAYGGNGGNIKALADKLNVEFYQYVLGRGLDQTTGPTGVVMMDYVSNKKDETVTYDGSYYLPSVIINNNVKHTIDIEDDDDDDVIVGPGEEEGDGGEA